MGVRHLGGSPWHLEYASVEHDENEKRRDKRNCRYYSKNNHCFYGKMYYCCGSSKCEVYSEKDNIVTKKPSNSEKVESYRIKNHDEKRLKEGSKIKLKDLEDNEILVFQIVKKQDEDFIENKICADSPLAKAVVKAKINDTIQVNEFARYKVLEIIDRKKRK